MRFQNQLLISHALGAQYKSHVLGKGTGQYSRATAKIVSRQCECDAQVARFSRYLIDSNSGLALVGRELLRINSAGGEERHPDFLVRMQKISVSMSSNGEGSRLLFLAREAPAAITSRMLRNLHGAKPGMLPIGKDGRIDIPACADGVRGGKPEFQSISRFLHEFDKIIVGGIFNDVKNAIEDIGLLSLELGISGKQVEVAYHFTMDDDGRLIKKG